MTQTLIAGSRPTAGPAISAPRSWSKDFLSRLVREPLLHFVLAGGLLFMTARMHADATDRHRIVVDPARVAQIEETWRLQYGSRPSAAVRENLVRKWIDEETLYREGVARGVDRDDEIIRRRIIQKMGFLSQDLGATPDPTEADLRAYYRSHAADYVGPGRVSFSHVFFSPDTRGPDTRGGEAARAAAERVLAGLTPAIARAPERGDRFSDRYDYADLSAADADRLFGRSPMALALFTAPVGRWSGPYRSGFGWHLTRVDARTPPTLPAFEAVEDRVRSDFKARAGAEADARALADVERRYTVLREDRSPGR